MENLLNFEAKMSLVDVSDYGNRLRDAKICLDFVSVQHSSKYVAVITEKYYPNDDAKIAAIKRRYDKRSCDRLLYSIVSILPNTH